MPPSPRDSRSLGFVLAGAYLAVAAGARAEEFSWELSGAASQEERDPLFDTDRWSVRATRYFDGVDDTRGPYALAPFFDPTTSVSANVGRDKRTSHPIGLVSGIGTPVDAVTETDEYAIGGRYVLPTSKWYFGGRYERSETDAYDVEGDAYGLLAGKYFGASTSLELALTSSEQRSQFDVPLCPPPICTTTGTFETELETDEAGLAVMHVRRFRSLTYSLFGRIVQTEASAVVRFPETIISIGGVPVTIPTLTSEADLPRIRTYSVGGELFPTSKVGIRLGYTTFDGDVSADDAYDVAVTWFFRRNVGLQFTFARQRADDATDFRYADTVGIRATGRF